MYVVYNGDKKVTVNVRKLKIILKYFRERPLKKQLVWDMVSIALVCFIIVIFNICYLTKSVMIKKETLLFHHENDRGIIVVILEVTITVSLCSTSSVERLKLTIKKVFGGILCWLFGF